MGRDEAAQVAYDGVPSSQETRTYSMKSTGSARSNSIRRKPVGAGAPAPAAAAAAAHPLIPTTPVPPIPPPKEQSYMQQLEDKRTSGQSNFSFERNSDSSSLHAGGDEYHDEQRDSISHTIPEPKSIAYGQRNVENGLKNLRISQAAEIGTVPQLSEPRNSQDGYHARPRDDSPRSSAGDSPQEQVPQLQYFHQMGNEPPPKARPGPRHRMQSPSQDSHSSSERGPGHYASRSDLQLHVPPSSTTPRPSSAYLPGADFRGRAHSPHLSVGGSPGGSPILQGRGASTNRRSPETRPISYVDLLNIPYSQQVAPSANLGANALLKNSVGQNAALLDTKKTLDMYRANVKKTQDSAVQYEFAVFMVQVARDLMSRPPGTDDSGMDPNELLREARSIFQKLADRSYPFAQYYLADGYASGVFNKGKEDYDRAFPLFVAASKHGHAEAGYRAALCYEFGWGCRKDYAKAVQFYRASASRNHPGAATRLGKACLTGDMGLTDKYREGLKWLKRAAESADPQYNAGPYELGLLHETGFGPDLFKDEAYAAQLFTQAADLGHPQASLRMGEAYEHGLLSCPRDPALSVHFYNGAAQAGIPEAMMNLCAWYMVGAEPVLEKDESEAYEWAKRAAEMGLPKAEYAIGYFTEMGIGCRRDPLEANVWYVRAADKGDERAKQRLAIIRAAASGEGSAAVASPSDKKNKKKDDKDCVIM